MLGRGCKYGGGAVLELDVRIVKSARKLGEAGVRGELSVFFLNQASSYYTLITVGWPANNATFEVVDGSSAL